MLSATLYPDKTSIYTGIHSNSLVVHATVMDSASTRRKALAEFLNVVRQRCPPEDFGFARGARRRTAGLRREEVAQLIGISPTWYTWIEQGREVNVSAAALDRLAATLRLTRSERAYLFAMADRRDPHGEDSEISERADAPPLLLELLADIRVPAYLMGRYWDILGCNDAAAELFTGWLDRPRADHEPRANMLRFVFLDAHARRLLLDWEQRARRITAEFRADSRERLDEPELKHLIDELSTTSADFARFWKRHDVLDRQGGTRGFVHPRHGLIHYRQTTLFTSDNDDVKLVLLKPVDTPDRTQASEEAA